MRRMKRIAISILICSLLIGTAGCRTALGAPVKDLSVAGSTFAEPLYVKQLDAWYQKTQVKAVYGASVPPPPCAHYRTGRSTSAQPISC